MKGTGLFFQLSSALLLTVAILCGSIFVSTVIFFKWVIFPDAHQWTYAKAIPFLANDAQLLVDRQDNLEMLTIWGEQLVDLNPELSLLLVTNEGQILWHAPRAAPLIRPNIDSRPLFEFAHLGTQYGLLRISDPYAEKGRVAFAAAPLRLPSPEMAEDAWLVLRIVPRTEMALKEWSTIAYLIKLLLPSLLLFPLVHWLLIQLLLRFLSRSLETLVTTANQLKQGEFTARAPVSSKDEIGYLASIFNQMSDTVVEKERNLKLKEEQRQRLVAAVLHDLRSPLAAMSAFLEIASTKRQEADRSEYDQLFESIRKGAVHQREHLDSLSELSALEVPEQVPDFQPCNVTAIAREVRELLSAEAESKAISLSSADDSEASVMVLGDRKWIGRAVMNIVRNAVSYTPRGGTVRIRVRHEAEYVRCDVEDTGVGIAAAEQEKIFEDFFRSEGGKALQAVGSGLGLGIVRRIVEQHGGKIELTSSLGQGTTISLLFPTRISSALLQEESTRRMGERAEAFASPVGNLPPEFSPTQAVGISVLILSLLLLPAVSPLAIGGWVLLNTIALGFYRASVRKEFLSGLAWPVCGICLGLAFGCFGHLVPNATFVSITAVLTATLGWLLLVAPVPRRDRLSMAVVLGAWLTYAAFIPSRSEVFWFGIILGVLIGHLLWHAFRSSRGRRFDSRFSGATQVLLLLLMVLLLTEAFYAFISLEMKLDRQLLNETLPKVAAKLEAGASEETPDADRTRVKTEIGQLAHILPRLQLTLEDVAGRPIVSTRMTLPARLTDEQRGPELAERVRCAASPYRVSFSSLISDPPERVCLSAPVRFGLLHGSFPEDHYRTAFRKLSENAGWLGLLVFAPFLTLLFVGLRFVCRRTVSDRISRLVSSIDMIERGKYEIHSRIEGTDEIALLSLTLHELSAAISARQQAIENSDSRRRKLVRDLIDALLPANRELLSAIDEVSRRLATEKVPFVVDETRRMYTTVTEQIQIVQDLLELSKLELDEVRIDRGSCSLEAVVANAAFSFNSTKRRIALDTVFNEPFEILADELTLERALTMVLHTVDRLNGQGERLFLKTACEDDAIITSISSSEHGHLDSPECRDNFLGDSELHRFPVALRLHFTLARHLLELLRIRVDLIYCPICAYVATMPLRIADPATLTDADASSLHELPAKP